MKRIIVVLLASLFLIESIAYADVDLSGLPQDELLELRYKIDTLIGYPVSGRYVTGVDIKEGYYTLTATDSSCYIKIYPDPEKAKIETAENLLQIFYLGKGQSSTIHLIDSNVLVISNHTVLLTPAQEPSWKP